MCQDEESSCVWLRATAAVHTMSDDPACCICLLCCLIAEINVTKNANWATKKRCESPLLFFLFSHRKADPVVHRLEVCFVLFFRSPLQRPRNSQEYGV